MKSVSNYKHLHSQSILPLKPLKVKPISKTRKQALPIFDSVPSPTSLDSWNHPHPYLQNDQTSDMQLTQEIWSLWDVIGDLLQEPSIPSTLTRPISNASPDVNHSDGEENHENDGISSQKRGCLKVQQLKRQWKLDRERYLQTLKNKL